MREWKFLSSSSPKIYTTQINPTTGLLSCDCPGWTVKKLGKVRDCKHTKKVAGDEALSLIERDGQWFVMDPVDELVRNVGKSAGSTAGNSTPAGVLYSKPQNSPTPALQNHPSTFISPMLASKMPEGNDADSYASGYVMEEKFDGHRLVVRVERKIHLAPATITAWSRLGNTRTLPTHLLNLLTDMPDGVYDGELLIPGQHSYDVTAGQNSGLEILVLFDMMECQGTSIMDFPLKKRREFLETAFEALNEGQEVVQLAEQAYPSTEVVQSIWDRGGEGAIIKHLHSKYQPGWRIADWIKVKKVLAATLTVTGFKAGKNGPYSIIKLKDDAGIETTVKTLNNKTLRQIALDPDSFIGRRLVVSYQEKTPSGHLRHIMWDHWAGESE